MKRFFLLIGIPIITFCLSVEVVQAQVPQFVCYQAVATDPAGHELISQPVKLRLSILKNSISGNEEWVETQNVTTDGFGLFDLLIGNGTRTRGSQTNFSGIKWGADKYYLKVEMDITGGTNYLLMGTTQLVSVPYALYSEKSNTAVYADSSGKAGFATRAFRADSSFYASRSGISDTSTYSLRASRADSSTYATSSSRADSSFYASRSSRSDTSFVALRATKADTAIIANMALTIFNNSIPKSDTAKFAWLADSTRRAVTAQSAVTAGYATNAGSAVTAQTAINAQNAQNALTAQTATNAVNASMAIKATYADSSGKSGLANAAKTALDDFDRDPTNEIQSLTYDSASKKLILSNPAGLPWVANLASGAFDNPGASIDYPLGILGSPVLITTNFTVPAGKTFFVSAVNGSITLADGRELLNEPGMPIIPENTSILSCYCSGILSSIKSNITPLILDLTSPAFTYTVPVGKTLIVKSGVSSTGSLSMQIDSDYFTFYTRGTPSPRLVVVTSGKTIKKLPTALNTEKLILSGYLLGL